MEVGKGSAETPALNGLTSNDSHVVHDFDLDVSETASLGTPDPSENLQQADPKKFPVRKKLASKYRLSPDLGAVRQGSPINDESVTRQARKGPIDDILACLSPNEELWILTRSPSYTTNLGRDSPGTGSLVATINQKQVPVPLRHTDVKARVRGYIATVDVTQSFHNPFSEKIEAIYVFPLPQNAAVNEFVMTIGDRRLRGIIRERHEAEEIYRQARNRGHVASLLTQERPNIFTQKVANIEPGKAIDIEIKYFNTLAYSDGVYEFFSPWWSVLDSIPPARRMALELHRAERPVRRDSRPRSRFSSPKNGVATISR
jgi:hypothetical protein